MTIEISWIPGLVGGLTAMIPGSIVFAPAVLGRTWMKELGLTEEMCRQQVGSSKLSAALPVLLTLVTMVVTALVMSIIANAAGAAGVAEHLVIALFCSWLMIAATLVLVFFERRSWALPGISAINHLGSCAAIGVVLGLFHANPR
ncbi:MAG: DUF1761 domain-containing protein [Gemmatimonadota bacterium]